jgi:dienelactone hydrolase
MLGDVVINVESQGSIIAHGVAHIRPAAANVVVRDVNAPGVTGVFAQQHGLTRQPAVIVLGGSEGGLSTGRWAAPLLASRGYAVLGLGYFRGDEPGLVNLPANLENIPVETLAQARNWLARQAGVDATRIAIVGVSKGAELALVGAVTFPWVTAVAAFAPSHVMWEGVPPDDANRPGASSWTFEGKALPYVRWSWSAMRRGDLSRKATGSSRLTEVHLESLAEYAGDVEAAVIPVERSQAAIFVAAGTDDGMWPSAFSADQIRKRLAQSSHGSTAIFEIHPTGHLIMGTGWAPTTEFQRSKGRLQGGNPRLDSEVQRTVWSALLKFLDQHLNSRE